MLQAHSVGSWALFTEAHCRYQTACLHKILIIYYSNGIMTKEKNTSSCFSFQGAKKRSLFAA